MPNEEEEVIVVKSKKVVTRLDAFSAAVVLREAANALESGEMNVTAVEDTE